MNDPIALLKKDRREAAALLTVLAASKRGGRLLIGDVVVYEGESIPVPGVGEGIHHDRRNPPD